MEQIMNQKIRESHRARNALIYIRQSSEHQVRTNTESTHLQYALKDRAIGLGWPNPLIIDEDLGKTAGYYAERPGFQRLVTQVSMGDVGIVISLEATRLARNNRDWYHLIDLCTLFDTLIGDHQTIYDPKDPNDRLVLGVKGTLSEAPTQSHQNAHAPGQALKGPTWAVVYDNAHRVYSYPRGTC